MTQDEYQRGGRQDQSPEAQQRRNEAWSRHYARRKKKADELAAKAAEHGMRVEVSETGEILSFGADNRGGR